MSRETRELRRPQPALPDLDAEEEVDLGRHAATVAARWWIPLAGLLAGAVLGYLLSLGAGKVYRAEATVYLGQPFSPNGGAPVQSLATNPRTVGQIVRSESALKAAARAAGMPVGKLRGRVSTQTVTGTTGPGAGRAGQNQLVEISVQGDAPRVATAANALAERVIDRVSDYVDVKIAAFKKEQAVQEDALASIARRINVLNQAVSAPRLAPLDKLVLISQVDNAEQRRQQLLQAQSQTEQQLSLAENVERADVVERAEPVKTTARSPRTSLLVGAALGLIAGIFAALLWEPVAGRFASRPL